MTDVVLRIGDVEFSDTEIPPVMPFGGQQRLVTHTLPGGARIVQALGRDDDPLEWGGVFRGPDASERARALDGMRIAGDPLLLTWHDFAYTVEIAAFRAHFEAPFRVPYQLSCIVVEDLTARAVWTPRPSVDAAVREDVGACAVETARIGDGPLSALNDTLQAIAAGIQDIQAAAYETIAPIIATAGSIRARVQILQDTAGAALNGAAALVSIVPGMSGSALAGRLRSAAAAAVQAPALHRLDTRMVRLTTNLNTAQFGATAVARTVSGGVSLFDLSAERFGDPRRWDEIARASGRADPFLRGVAQVRIPQ